MNKTYTNYSILLNKSINASETKNTNDKIKILELRLKKLQTCTDELGSLLQTFIENLRGSLECPGSKYGLSRCQRLDKRSGNGSTGTETSSKHDGSFEPSLRKYSSKILGK